MDVMRRAQLGRWTAGGGLIALLGARPGAAGNWPHGGTAVAAPVLFDRIRASADVAYSGYAESTGALDLPVTTGQLGTVADLFGSSTQLRIWWRADQDHRVDQVSTSGEVDLHAFGGGVW